MNLLQARSGIYLPTLGESPGMVERKPARGSASPGEIFYYNNWDFNVLGTIFEKQTGMTLGSAFTEWIALPIGMEDFEPADVHYQADEISGHRMYRFYMSARDLARFGRLYTSHGKWGTQSIIPEEWVAATFTKYSEVSYSSSADGYGLLWWIDSAANVFMAEGSGGQFLFVSPDRNLVMVTLNDRGISFLGRKFHNPLARSASYTEAKRLWDIVLADISARSF